MTYLIFGIVVMLVTWWICSSEIKYLNSELSKSNTLHIESVTNLLNKNTALLKQIEELKSELITTKAMRETRP